MMSIFIFIVSLRDQIANFKYKKTQTENIDKNKMDYSEHKKHSENQNSKRLAEPPPTPFTLHKQPKLK